MNGLEKIIASISIPLAWVGSIEWRLRGKVNSERFNDLKDQMVRMEGKIDHLIKNQQKNA